MTFQRMKPFAPPMSGGLGGLPLAYPNQEINFALNVSSGLFQLIWCIRKML